MRYTFNPEFFVLPSSRVMSAVCALGLCAFLAGCDSAGVHTELESPQPEGAINPHFA